MDGLFRGYRTPPKRSASGPSLSPFSTSLSQLQEVTLGANGSLADQTKISPMRGRSVKEYDEQLTTLKKENFNLKLRIYFLEERMGSTYRPEDKDNIIRKNIEFKVEIEALRKDLDEKQDLLCQAVKALELEDEEHKRLMAMKDSKLQEHNERISDLELELKKLSHANDELLANQEQVMNNSTQMYTQAFGLQSENARAKEEIQQLQQHITDLETQLAEERDHSLVLENEAREAECLQQRCQNLTTELEERNEKLKELVTELEQNGHTLSSYNLRIRTLEDALISANSDVNFKDEELAHREKIVQEQSAEIEELRRMVEESQVLCDKEQRQSENLKNAIMSRDNTIADLESKWEKSKSVIRKLEAKLDSTVHETKRQRDEIQTLKLQRRTKSDIDSKESPRKLRSNSSNSTTCSNETETVTVIKQEMIDKDYKLSELKQEQLKAYNIIQQFISKTKSLEKEVADMKVSLLRKNQQIEELQSITGNGRITGLKPMSLPSQFDNISRREEKENSVEDSDEVKAAEEMKKCAAGDATALEWEKHVEELMEVIEEKEQQLDLFKEQCKHTTATLQQRDNRIVELEKEVDELRTELSTINVKLDAVSEEKLDTSTEKAAEVSWQRVTEEKDKKIEQLESEVRKHTFNLQGIVNTELWDKNREIEKLQNRFTEKLRLKETEVTQLEKDITSKDLQLKMLKDKISELGVHVNLPCSLLTPKSNVDHSAEPLEKMTALQEQLKILTEERKYLQQTVEELRQQLRNTPERDSDNKIMQLKHEYSKLQLEYDKSEKLRMETVNLCSLLTNRLEELAHFLDSLLKLKSVLGVLGSKQRSAIKQAIDQSLDLSKSLSVSMMNEDQSLAQLSSISGLLNTTQTSVNMSIFDPWQADQFEQQKGNVSLTYNSHLSRTKGGDVCQNDMLSEQTEIIKVLRAQIETMKKEIEIRDMELNKQNMEQILSSDGHELKNDNDLVEALIDLQNKSSLSKKTIDILSPNKIFQNLLADKSGSSMKTHLIDNQSESEAWSEPDRCVSQARIGLDAEVLKNNSTPNLNRTRSNKSASLEGTTTSESTEGDELNKSHNRTPSKRGSGSIESRHTVNLLQDHLMIMENKLKEKENEILSLQANVMELTNKTLEVKLHMAEEVAQIRNEKMDVEKLLKELEEKVKNVDVQGSEELIKLENAFQEKEDALIDTKLQLETLKSKLELVEETLHEKEKEYAEQLQEKDTECHEKLRENEDKWQTRVQKIEADAEQHLVEIHQTMEHLKKQYESEYIQKTELTKHVQEMEVLFNELESLKEILNSTEAKMRSMEENELALRKKFEESEESHREKIIALKREINEATLRTSQAVLERTKISNEKLKLEAEIRKLETLNCERGKELDEKDKDLINMRNNLQKQLSQTEQQKSCLQLKVSELETMNADLHNRLVKIQTTGSNENVWTKSRSTSPPKISELLANYKVVGKHSLGTRLTFTRQKSDMSGYASEDVLTDDNDGGVFNRSAPETFHWYNQTNANVVNNVTDVRTAANSSPDLGIESDQGRFSSLETNVATRPLLQTLELTASMNNLLSADQLDNVGHYCNIIAHKTLEKENSELQKLVSRLEVGLERTRSQLSVINQNKRQVEKAVCKQIHKTSIVLRQARANLDSGSENDIPKRK
ncbi:centrosomin [Carabus blaptoides fortunei]